VDVLVIVPNIKDEWDRSKISVKLHKAINAWDPFEIHVITPEEYKN
jgi:predicted nucleotidyltransferase